MLASLFRCRFLSPLNRGDVDQDLIEEFEDRLGDRCIPVVKLSVKLAGRNFKADGVHISDDFLRRSIRPKLLELIKKQFF